MTDTTSTEAPAKRDLPAWLKALLPGVLGAIVVGVFVSAFLWPLKVSEPGDIAFGVTGPEQQVSQIEQQFAAKQADLFNVTNYDDRDAVMKAIETRDIEGGLVVSDAGIEMLTASAGNPQVAQMLTQMAAGMKEQQQAAAQQAVTDAVKQAQDQGVPAEQILALQQQAQEKAAAVTVTATDVVSAGSSGAAANLLMLPALIGGMATAMLAFFMVARPRLRIITLLAGSVFAGLVGAAVLGPWFDILPGSFAMNSLALGMGILAISAMICGLATLLGPAGIGIGVVLMMLIGNPWGGMLVPTEFLPGFMGWLGAHMPNGNVITLMKNINFFPDATQAGQWWMHIIWAATGLVLLLIGALVQASKHRKPGNLVAITA